MAKQERDNSVYDSLKWSHKDLTNELNFAGTGKSADEIYRKLKIRIVDEYYAALHTQGLLYKAMWISIALMLVIWIGSALMPFLARLLGDSAPILFIIFLGLSVAFYKWARSYDSKFQAYRDFDEDFFGGEVFYKLEKGLKI